MVDLGILSIGSWIQLLLDVLSTTIISYFALKVMKDDRSFLRVFLVVLISNLVAIFVVPFLVNQLGLHGIISFILLLVTSFLIYKYGLDISWFNVILLIIVSIVLAFVIGFILAALGIAAAFGLSLLL